MSTRILVNGSLAAGKQVLEFTDAALALVQQGKRLKAQLDSMSSGNDWPQVATETGCPGNQAQDLWSIISTAVTQLDAAQVAELARLDQG